MSAHLLVQALTFVRVPMAIAFAVALPWCLESMGQGRPMWLVGCLALLLAQELSDVLDGHLARRLGVVSPWGKMFDPYADSVSRLIVYWSLASAGLTLAVLPLVMALRDVTVAYARLAMAQRGVSVAARMSGKIKAWVQGLGAMALLSAPLQDGWAASGGPLTSELLSGWPLLVSWIVLAVTVASAVEYVRGAFSENLHPPAPSPKGRGGARSS